jgi:hypothetical protein
MKKCKTILFIAFLFSGCAHYFKGTSTIKQNTKVTQIKHLCLREGQSIENSQILSRSNPRFGKLYNLLEKNYQSIQISCEKESSLTIVFFEDEKELFGDFWIITLGIVPGVYSKEFAVKIFNVDKSLIYESNAIGKNIVSIFLVPFYFFNKKSYHVVFDEIDLYLKPTRTIQ